VPVRGISCLRSPTPQINPPDSGETLWRLISQLSLNHVSLSGTEGLEALREVLRLHGASTAGAEQQLRGLTAMETHEKLMQLGKDAWRGFVQGTEVTLTFDESCYVGSCAVLFGAVLSRFLGLYTSVNSFTQLVMRSTQREGVWMRWAALAGDKPLL
jgi:type VI secretion system protein ImpG